MLTIFHTNDFHNKLKPEKAKVLQERLHQCLTPYLLVDAGDAGGSGNINFNPAGEPILDTMSELGYMAMTVGNRDFHVSWTGFRAKLSRATFPILCANVRRSNTPIPSVQSLLANTHPLNHPSEPKYHSDTLSKTLRSHLILEPIPSFKVVLFGLLVPMITERMWERHLSAFVFEEPITFAKKFVPALVESENPDLLIALTHIGLSSDRLLAEALPQIGLIIGGHSHNTLDNGERVGDTLIVQTGSHARNLGIVELHPTSEAKPSLSARLESL